MNSSRPNSSLNNKDYVVRINPITGEELHYYKSAPPTKPEINYEKDHQTRVNELIPNRTNVNNNKKITTSTNTDFNILPLKEASNSSTIANASSIPLLNFSELLNSDSNRINNNEKDEDMMIKSKMNDFKNQNPIIAPEIVDRSARPVSSYRYGYKDSNNFSSPLLNYQTELQTEKLPSKLEAPRNISEQLLKLDLESLNKPATNKKNSIYKIERVADLEKLWLTMTPSLQQHEHQLTSTKDLKEKLVIDTVLTDQLSKFSLSDPNQTESMTGRLNQHPLRTIYTNQGNKFTLIDRQKTTAKGDLSKRIKFNCRVRSSNGKIALRELFGLFFLTDGSLTIYEFRLLCGAYLTGMGSGNVSKKANALPFLNRKIYKHSYGRRKNLQIDIYDIFKGSILYIPLQGGCSHLPDHLTQNLDYLELEITDVDELEKENMLVSFKLAQSENNGILGEQMNKDILDVKNRLKITFSNEEINDMKIINSVRLFIRGQIENRSVEVYMGMSAKLKQKGLISQQEFCDTLLEYNVLIHSEDVNIVWQCIDLDMSNYLSYYKLMRTYFGQMNSTRHAYFRMLILKLDTQKIGYVQVNDIYKYYKAARHPKVRQGKITETDMFKTFLSQFQLLDPKKVNELNELSFTTAMDNTKSLLISYEQLEDYYNGLSICVDSDTDFIQILQNSWNV